MKPFYHYNFLYSNDDIYFYWNGTLNLGTISITRCRLTSIGIPIIKICRLTYNGNSHILKDRLYIESGPWLWYLPQLMPVKNRPAMSSSGALATTHNVDITAPMKANRWLNIIPPFLEWLTLCQVCVKEIDIQNTEKSLLVLLRQNDVVTVTQ